MRVRKTWIGVVLLVLFAVAACGRDPSPDPAAESAAPSVSSSDEAGSDTAAATFLDGTWEARTTRDAYLDYLVDHGVRRADAVAAAELDHGGSHFSVRFTQGLFNVTGPTGDSWQRGDFEVRGDTLLLWDDGFKEVGFRPLRLVLERSGSSVRFRLAPGQKRGPDHRPGVPELVAGGALWCPAPWRKVAQERP